MCVHIYIFKTTIRGQANIGAKQSPSTGLHIYHHLIYNKDATAIQWGKDGAFQ